MARGTRLRLRWGVWAGMLAILGGCAMGQGPEGAEARAKDLAQDVNLLSEINRIGLSKDSLTKLVGVVSEIQEYLSGRGELRDDIWSRLEAQLQAQRDALLRDQPVPMATTRQIEELNAELADFAINTEQELLALFALKVKAVLTPEQIDTLTWADETQMQAVTYLDWVREMTDEEYNTEAPIAAESLSDGREITADQVAEILRTARALGEAEYEAGKSMLAKQLVPALRDDEISTDLILVRRMEPPRLLPLLKAKLAQMP